jgi:23S rRNA (cytidine2498-2'-O)-methyltransferase
VIVVAYCRAGFEGEAMRDIERLAAAAGVRGAAAEPRGEARATALAHDDATPGSGYIVATLDGLDLTRWRAAIDEAPPVFCRSVFVGSGPHAIAPGAATPARGRTDRVTPLAEAIAATGARGSTLWVEFADTNEGKAMSTLARAIEPRLAAALRERGILEAADGAGAGSRRAPRNQRRLHVFLASDSKAYVGTSIAGTGSPWPMGIPRLRMPGGAPSRSTQKLAEALVTFLGDDESTLLRAGQRAVDLGAAPGGWSWQLAHRGLRVTAVDNGVLKGEVAHDPLVTHVRADGFRYRPKRAVDWVVCDIVEQPSRVAALMARWIGGRDARRAIFNLKLPMKRRFDAIDAAAATIDAGLGDTTATLRLHQLYHDREEVTGYLARLE